MRTTNRPGPRRGLIAAVATVAAVGVLTVTTPNASAQETLSATISSACDGVRLGVITVEITGEVEDGGLIAMIDGSVLGPARPGTNEYPYQQDATSVVDVLLVLDGSTSESIARETITIDCVADTTTTSTVPAPPTTTAPAPAPDVADRTVARQVSFTG